MTNSFTHPVFEPYQSRLLKLKNRAFVAPMTQIKATKEGVPTTGMIHYYDAYAQGGFAAIVTEGVYPDDVAGKAYEGQPGIVTRHQVDGWSRIVAEVKNSDTIIFCQLMHGGALSQVMDQTLAPSAVQPLGTKLRGYGGEGAFPVPTCMTADHIREVVDGFAASARRAQEAGFDGVEIHGANGYLIDQFLTDYTNLRTDEYGGSFENRVRIVKEIIDAIRGEVGGNFVVGLRLSEAKVNNLTYRWPGGAAHARQLLMALEKTKPDYLHVASEGGPWDLMCTYSDGSSLTSLAKQILQIPVVANGGLHDLTRSRIVLDGNHADLISIGKAALGDPHWLGKLQHGKKPIPFHAKHSH
jgi:2,4-dienoyl-CoA reductase-like NADH-dependent reductase (Old Yellow Enzyme family)